MSNLEAYLAVNAVILSPVTASGCQDCYRSHELQTYWAKSDNPVSVEILYSGRR